MQQSDETSIRIPYTPNSSVENFFHVMAVLGGGPPHQFRVDTGSVGIIVPRTSLGPDYQDFDKSQDTTFGYVSSGNAYQGQWVEVPVVFGVPKTWDGTGDYPVAQIEVFAVDQPATPTIGMLGIGFAIGNNADGGPERNPLLNMTYQGQPLSQGYIIGAQGIEVGLAPENSDGFIFVALARNADGGDWLKPMGTLSLPNDGFTRDLPVLVDTGIGEMLLWVEPEDRPSGASDSILPGTPVSVVIPASDSTSAPALQFSFVAGDANDPMTPATVDWRKGPGSVNTGIRLLAGYDYLYDAAAGRIGFCPHPT